MMSLDDMFFSRGGFSSSRSDDTETIDDADMMGYLIQNDLNQSRLTASQVKSRREHKRLKGGFST